VCFDTAFPEHIRRAALAGAEIVAVPMNSPAPPRPTEPIPIEIAIAMAAANASRVYVVQADRTGEERGVRWAQASVIVDPDGSVVAGPEDGEALLVADLDPARARDKSWGDRNDVFGDPCSKTTKTLALEVACGAGPVSNGCPFSGHVTYTLTKSANPTAAEAAAYARITVAMDAAVANYNCYANLTKATTVTYNPSVETADGNVNGSIRFGASPTYMTLPTSMHEIAHTLGVGSSQFAAMTSNKIFNGTNATSQIREITGNATEQVHSDGTHFWPYGLNYDSEYHGLSDAINHCKMVTAIRKDLGMN